MARIRTIKPEFWEDEIVGSMPREMRLLYIATWNLADDEGILRWSPEFLKANVFMYDDDISCDQVSRLMDGLAKLDIIFPYLGGKTHQRLAYVINFRRHQKINRPQESRHPYPSLQNREVIAMYSKRDRHICHLCGGEVQQDITARDYDRMMASPDHLKARAHGGTDAPSNIGTSHLSCNKGRAHREIPDSSPHAVNRSVNGAVNDSHPEGNGREGNGREVERADGPSVEAIVCAHPLAVTRKLTELQVTQAQAATVVEALASGETREGLLAKVQAIAKVVIAEWPPGEMQFLSRTDRFFREHEYNRPIEEWKRGKHEQSHNANRPSPATQRQRESHDSIRAAAARRYGAGAGDDAGGDAGGETQSGSARGDAGHVVGGVGGDGAEVRAADVPGRVIEGNPQ